MRIKGLDLDILLWIAAGLLLVAIFLLKRGLWPRRQGDAPHCRKCGYNLTGLESGRCPECGVAAGPKTIVRGRRCRRPLEIVVGMMYAGLASAPLYMAARQVDWYPYYPTAWVVNDLRSPDGKTANKASGELNRRVRAGRTSAVVRGLTDVLDRNPRWTQGYSLLGEFGTPEAQAYYARAVRAPDVQDRTVAVKALSEAGGRWAVPLLISCLDDPDLRVQPKDPALESMIGRPWPEEHFAHEALVYCLRRIEWKRPHLTPSMRHRDLRRDPIFDLDGEIDGLKSWWARHGEAYLEGESVPRPEISLPGASSQQRGWGRILRRPSPLRRGLRLPPARRPRSTPSP